ncbi:MAG: hypothetical protein J6V66_01490 [Clostridia bacterium]|nr:hypothetical protein [Clostridia bacterium]
MGATNLVGQFDKIFKTLETSKTRLDGKPMGATNLVGCCGHRLTAVNEA